jgi:phosphoribosyl-ATP pyrophosphohydrolase
LVFQEVAEVTIKEAITTLAAEAEATAIAKVTEAAAVAVTEVAQLFYTIVHIKMTELNRWPRSRGF